MSRRFKKDELKRVVDAYGAAELARKISRLEENEFTAAYQRLVRAQRGEGLRESTCISILKALNVPEEEYEQWLEPVVNTGHLRQSQSESPRPPKPAEVEEAFCLRAEAEPRQGGGGVIDLGPPHGECYTEGCSVLLTLVNAGDMPLTVVALLFQRSYRPLPPGITYQPKGKSYGAAALPHQLFIQLSEGGRLKAWWNLSAGPHVNAMSADVVSDSNDLCKVQGAPRVRFKIPESDTDAIEIHVIPQDIGLYTVQFAAIAENAAGDRASKKTAEIKILSKGR